MIINRRKSIVVKVGNVYIGGKNPVAIQSMAKTKTSDIEKTIKQIKELEAVGCEIVRLAVKDDTDARAIKQIKRGVRLPIVADIHFSPHLAILAIEAGADKIRLNPGNISKKQDVQRIVSALKIAKIPLRVGLNSGSTDKGSLIRSCLNYLKIVEKLKFYDTVISVKASNVLDTIEAYRKIAGVCDYPLHLGVTATGSPFSGAIKSSVAIGSLLAQGIGDTIRVSLTANPVEEVIAAKAILESLELRKFGPEVISCPTCGRCEVDLVSIVKELEQRLVSKKNIKIAAMGCVVNGPGEAKEADIGVAFGKKDGLLFKKGKAIRKIPYNRCVEILLKEIKGL